MLKSCKIDSKNFVLCKALSKIMGDRCENHRGHGVSLFVTTSFVPDERRIHGVVYKENAKDGGILLNFCPFCRSSLLPE